MPARTPPTLDQLVARQVRRWAQQQAQDEVAAPSCIALTRFPSSGAAEIGLKLPLAAHQHRLHLGWL